MRQRFLLPDIVAHLASTNLGEIATLTFRNHVTTHLVEGGEGLGFPRVANPREQVCYLMRVHAGRGYFDWTGPVEIVVAEGKGERL